MARRKAMSPQKSKRLFSKTAQRSKTVNTAPKPMRGGIRM